MDLQNQDPLHYNQQMDLIKDQENLKNIWAEHVSTLLNRPSTLDPTALEQVPQDLNLLP